jgi:hypothetical protein
MNGQRIRMSVRNLTKPSAVREAAAKISEEVRARLASAEQLSGENRKAIIENARQALAPFQPKPEGTHPIRKAAKPLGSSWSRTGPRSRSDSCRRSECKALSPLLAESGQRTSCPMAASGERPAEVKRGGAGERTAKLWQRATPRQLRKLTECDLTKPPPATKKHLPTEDAQQRVLGRPTTSLRHRRARATRRLPLVNRVGFCRIPHTRTTTDSPPESQCRFLQVHRSGPTKS